MVRMRAIDTAQAVLLFHALSDETRLRIVERLREGEQCVCDLTEAFKTGQSRLSFHLKVLKDAGLVTDRREGRWIYYALRQDAIAELADMVAWFNEPADTAYERSQCR